MDTTYKRNKKAIDKTGKLMTELNKLTREVKSIKREIEDIKIAIIRADEDKDSAKSKLLQKDLKTKQSELKPKKQQLEKLQAIVQKTQESINEKMDELSRNPELKAHLDSVIETKFTRKLAKYKKEKTELEGKNATLKTIRDAAIRNPNIMFSIKQIEDCKKTEVKLNAIISDPSKTAAEKSKATADLDYNKRQLDSARANLAKSFKGKVSRDVIDKIVSFDSLEKDIRSNDRELKGYNKQIANYQTALESLIANRPHSNSREHTSTSRETGHGGPLVQQPKWYQFIKRFKNWNARRKMESEVEAEPTDSESKTSFRDSMKYDIVKDYEQQIETDLLRQAKSYNRESSDRERDDD